MPKAVTTVRKIQDVRVQLTMEEFVSVLGFPNHVVQSVTVKYVPELTGAQAYVDIKMQPIVLSEDVTNG